MTLGEALLYSTTRSLTVATLALFPASHIYSFICQPNRTKSLRLLITVASLLPLLIPELLVGFTYRLAATKLLDNPWTTELLYAAILMARASTVILVVRLILPESQVSRESLYSWKLLHHHTAHWFWGYIQLLTTGPFRVHIIGWSIAVLLCFQEFETAALVQIDRHPVAWTVWLFDAHAAGEPLSASLAMMKWPLIFELIILLPVFWLMKSIRSSGTSTIRQQPQSKLSPSVTGLWLSVILFGFIAWPIFANARQLIDGVALVFQQPLLFQQSLSQIGSSLAFATVASILVLLIAASLVETNRRTVAMALVFPGLMGSLVLGLLLLTVFQSSWLSRIYDTPIPMITGLVLLMFPRALLLAAVLKTTSAPESVHSAQLLLNSKSRRVQASGRGVLWKLIDLRWLIAGGILLHWSFWDVTIPSILRPLRFEPVVTRLYGEMHYGRTETLSAITLLSLLAPLFAAFAAVLFWRFVRQLSQR